MDKGAYPIKIKPQKMDKKLYQKEFYLYNITAICWSDRLIKENPRN